jgi:hypothetical protein
VEAIPNIVSANNTVFGGVAYTGNEVMAGTGSEVLCGRKFAIETIVDDVERHRAAGILITLFPGDWLPKCSLRRCQHFTAYVILAVAVGVCRDPGEARTVFFS